MLTKVLALFGFAPSAAQVSRPPLFAYLFLLAAAYFSAHIVEYVAWVLGSWGVYLRTVGVASAFLVGHSLYRAIAHQDDNSMGGYIRKQLVG